MKTKTAIAIVEFDAAEDVESPAIKYKPGDPVVGNAVQLALREGWARPPEGKAEAASCATAAQVYDASKTTRMSEAEASDAARMSEAEAEAIRAQEKRARVEAEKRAEAEKRSVLTPLQTSPATIGPTKVGQSRPPLKMGV